MRYAVLSDVHGNLPALRAAIAALDRVGVDAWLCAGDLVGYGPQPNECVEVLAELGALCVAGNHDALVLHDHPAGAGGGLVGDSIRWTRAVLGDDCRDYLARLPRIITTAELVMAHASLEDGHRYVRYDADAADQLRRLAVGYPGSRALILGHTHRQWAYGQAGGTRPIGRGPISLAGEQRFLLNPGAVGQSREPELRPRARFMLLDTELSEATMFQHAYDCGALRRALRQQGLPWDVIHRPPGLLATRRRARRLVRRLRTRIVAR